MEGKLYAGITLNWDYANKSVDLSMSKYVDKNRAKFNHKTPKLKYDSPSRYIPPKYGKNNQEIQPKPELPKLSKEQILDLQRIVGAMKELCHIVLEIHWDQTHLALSVSNSNWAETASHHVGHSAPKTDSSDFSFFWCGSVLRSPIHFTLAPELSH